MRRLRCFSLMGLTISDEDGLGTLCDEVLHAMIRYHKRDLTGKIMTVRWPSHVSWFARRGLAKLNFFGHAPPAFRGIQTEKPHPPAIGQIRTVSIRHRNDCTPIPILAGKKSGYYDKHEAHERPHVPAKDGDESEQ